MVAIGNGSVLVIIVNLDKFAVCVVGVVATVSFDVRDESLFVVGIVGVNALNAGVFGQLFAVWAILIGKVFACLFVFAVMNGDKVALLVVVIILTMHQVILTAFYGFAN